MERYTEAASDSELLSLREEVTLIDARLADVLTRVDTGESGQLWTKAREAWKAFRAAMAKGDTFEISITMADVEECLGQGVADWAAWNEVGKLLNARKSLVESERKRLVEMQATMTAEQAMTFVAALTDAVKRNVTDRRVLTAVTDDIARLLNVNARESIEAGSNR